MTDIFISYSREDEIFARTLATSLSNLNLNVWIDVINIAAGQKWSSAIQQGLDTSALMLVIISPDSMSSSNVEDEWQYFLDQNKPIVPILWRPAQLHFQLNRLQYVDFDQKDYSEAMTELIMQLRYQGIQVDSDAIPHSIEFVLEKGNLVDISADVVALKYSNKQLHGSALYLMGVLAQKGLDLSTFEFPEKIGEYKFLETEDIISIPTILYIGVPKLGKFRYGELRKFAEDVLKILATEKPQTQHLVMTVHGPGYGLDEMEAMIAQCGGFVDALYSGRYPPALQKITIIEKNKGRFERMYATLEGFFEEANYAHRIPHDESLIFQLQVDTISQTSDAPVTKPAVKPYAITLLSEDEDLIDIFQFGIQKPIRATGLLCERLFLSDVTPNELSNVQQHIADAKLIVVELSDIHPLHYLQIGYALGKNVPMIFLAKDGTETIFESENNIRYTKIWELEERLSQNLQKMKKNGIL